MSQHRVARRPGSPRAQYLSALVGVVLLAVSWMLSGPVAMAQSAGELRLGHLSPRTPAVDIYLTPPGATPSTTPLARGVAYGAVTGFESLAPGRYTVDMRVAGAAPASLPPVTAAVDVAAGSAQSLLFFDTGAGGTVQGNLLTDDLTPAAAGDGRVRIVQGDADAGSVDMQALGGPRLATALQYGTATDYATVAARSWDVAVTAGGQQLQVTLPVNSGSVSTVVLTRAANGALTATPLADVSGTPTALMPGSKTPTGAPVQGSAESAAPAKPHGGVGAGGGGTAGDVDPAPLLAALGVLLVVVAAVSRTRTYLARRHA